MKFILAAAAAAGALALSAGGAASQNSPAQCDAYARQQANATVGGNVAGATLFGTILGAGIGAAGGNAGAGAGIGAGLGLAGGLAANGPAWQNAYSNYYGACINAQPAGYAPPQPVYGGGPGGNPPYAGGYQPWTAEWYAYCQATWRSFDPNTGWYRASSGGWQWCRTRY